MKYSRKRRGGKAGDFELAKELQKEQSALEKKKSQRKDVSERI